MSFRRILFVLTLVASMCPAGAQEKTPLVRRVLDRLLAPSMELDPAAAYQPEPRWSFALSGDLNQASYQEKQDFFIPSAKLDDKGEMIIKYLPGTVSYHLNGGMVKGFGLQAGYGNISLSLSKKFRGEGTNSSYSVDYMSAGYALQVQYFSLSNPVDYDFIEHDEPFPPSYPMGGQTENPGRLRALIVDTFYSFNRRSFVYSAAYKGNIIQRRSAGSWIFGTKLILEDFKLDPSEDVVALVAGFGLQTCAQVSFGGGYSFNFVPLHRQPVGEREKGLRNLTLNVTAIPMVTLFNQFTTTAFQKDGDTYVPSSKSVLNGKLKINYVYRVGVGYTRDLFTYSLSASSDSYTFNGISQLQVVGQATFPVETSGLFSRWTVGVHFCKRF